MDPKWRQERFGTRRDLFRMAMTEGEGELLRQWRQGLIRPADALFLLELCHMQPLGQPAIWKPQKAIAVQVGEPYQTVRNRISRLRKLGWVRTVRNPDEKPPQPLGLVLNPDLSTKGRGSCIQQQDLLWERAEGGE